MGNQTLDAIDHIQASPPLPVQPPLQPQNYVTWGTLLFTVILVSLISSVGSVFVYHRYVAPRFVSFDLPKHLRAIQADVAKMGPGQEKEMTDKIQKQMTEIEKIVTEQPKNVVILSSDIVLGDSKPVRRLVGPSLGAAPAVPAQ